VQTQLPGQPQSNNIDRLARRLSQRDASQQNFTDSVLEEMPVAEALQALTKVLDWVDPAAKKRNLACFIGISVFAIIIIFIYKYDFSYLFQYSLFVLGVILSICGAMIVDSANKKHKTNSWKYIAHLSKTARTTDSVPALIELVRRIGREPSSELDAVRPEALAICQSLIHLLPLLSRNDYDALSRANRRFLRGCIEQPLPHYGKDNSVELAIAAAYAISNDDLDTTIWALQSLAIHGGTSRARAIGRELLLEKGIK
jgi:hypothetical protein